MNRNSQRNIQMPRHQTFHVTLASKIPEDVCKKINLNYRDPATINEDEFKDKEDEGILFVPKAGEQLYKLNT